MRVLFPSLFFALLAAIAFSLLSSLWICLGLSPDVRGVSDMTSPMLGILTGAYFTSRKGSWKTGAGIGLAFVVLWLGFWMYVMGRLNPLLWITEGLSHLTPAHALWWAIAILAGISGGLLGRIRLPAFFGLLALLYSGVLFIGSIFVLGDTDSLYPMEPMPGCSVERTGPAIDGTFVYFLTFDFQRQNRFSVGLYDCDSDDAKPYDDANTSYLGQDLKALIDKLTYQAAPSHREIMCVINGGFFGASSLSIAHHEEPLVEDGRALYNVDLLRPSDQSWFFAVHSPNAVFAGQPRFSMAPTIPWNTLPSYQTVLGGVRPLRFEGHSFDLKPGAGATTLRCSRTSIGWSADGSKFYVLSVFDPDGELASQLQRKMHATPTGGWDVAEVQKFWEQKQVPNALLFDGGESTQLAFRRPDGDYTSVAFGYQYGFTLGYLFQRPLLFTLPILPPSEAHRGVLNYLYVEGPATQ